MNEFDITFTENAIAQVRTLLESDFAGPDIQALRVFVQGGGCSGFQYGFTFEKEMADDDVVFDYEDVKFVIDPLSIMYLNGATIDYKKSLAGEQFTIDNPNTTSQCGCGNSVGF